MVASVTSDSGGSRSSGPYYASEPSTAPLPSVGSGPSRYGRRGKRRKAIIAATAGVLAVVTGIAAVIVVVGSGGNADSTGFLPTGNSAGQDAEQITGAFLQAWQAGDLARAARYTDHPSVAEAALVTYRKYLHLRKLTGTVRSGTAVSVSRRRASAGYAINATVATSDGAKAPSGTWSYHASLVAYQKRNAQVWYIAWAPDVLAPNLTSSTHLAAVQVAPGVAVVNDASGKDIASYQDAGLTPIASLLKRKAPPGQGTPGLSVEIQTASGQAVRNSQAAVTAPGNVSLATTIDAKAEAAARTAVVMHPSSSMVAIQPSTGNIVALANNAGDNDFALTAQVAPGSTMKVITSAALISSGVVSASSAVGCPATYTVQGTTYHNDNNESEPASTPFVTDFAQSCNNAFSTQWQHLSGGGLTRTAKEYFGLNQDWNIGTGVPDSYFHAPANASGSELAQEAFGQGQLTAAPLAMASVAADRGHRHVQAADPADRNQPGHRHRASGQHRCSAEANDAGRGHQRDSRVDRVRIGRVRQDRNRRRPGPAATQQLADRLRPGQGRRGSLPGRQCRPRCPVRRPRGESFPRQVLTLTGFAPTGEACR